MQLIADITQNQDGDIEVHLFTPKGYSTNVENACVEGVRNAMLKFVVTEMPSVVKAVKRDLASGKLKP